MKLKPLYYIIALLMLVGSCTVTDKERAYINKIDRLGNALDSVALQYYAIDTNKLFYVI